MIESLEYLIPIRPDIMHVECLKEIHLLIVKGMLRYLKGKASYDLFCSVKRVRKQIYLVLLTVDDRDNRKSYLRYAYILNLGLFFTIK